MATLTCKACGDELVMVAEVYDTLCQTCYWDRELQLDVEAELRAQELREARYDEDSGYYVPDGVAFPRSIGDVS